MAKIGFFWWPRTNNVSHRRSERLSCVGCKRINLPHLLRGMLRFALRRGIAYQTAGGGDGVASGGSEGHLVNESWLFDMGAKVANSPKTAQEVAMKFTEEEKEEIRRMKGMSRIL